MALVRSRFPRAPDGVLLLDGWARIPVRSGQTVTGSLLAAGVLATSRSLKYRRPRGPFCLRGDCGTCLVRIDGRPNLRACQVAARPGMQVESQNRSEQGSWEPSDWLDAWIGRSLDHHHLVLRPRWANRWMQQVARRLSGLGALPSGDLPTMAEPEHREVRVVVVGGGVAGRAVAEALGAAADEVVVLDRGQEGDAVFGLYTEEGVVAAGTDGRGSVERLRTFSAEHVVLATGTRESMAPFPGNDRPGVVSARGLCELLEREALELAAPAVVVGRAPWASAYGERLGVPFFDLDQVHEVLGTHAIDTLVLSDGRRIPANLIALAEAPSAASDLARQAGAGVTWADHAGFVVERDAEGRCTTTGPWQLWACGAVCGVLEREAARADGARVGAAIARRIAAKEHAS